MKNVLREFVILLILLNGRCDLELTCTFREIIKKKREKKTSKVSNFASNHEFIHIYTV